MSEPPTVEQRIEALEAKRSERREVLEAQRLEQLATDLEALDGIEAEHGCDNVARLNLARFLPGLPTMVVVRAASKAENKRFQDRAAKGRKGDRVDPVVAIKAAEEVADCCVLYPDKETYVRVREEFHSVHQQAGTASIKLCQANTEAEGKE